MRERAQHQTLQVTDGEDEGAGGSEGGAQTTSSLLKGKGRADYGERRGEQALARGLVAVSGLVEVILQSA